jgi:hypothetical protein
MAKVHRLVANPNLFPILIEYWDGTRAICKTTDDIRSGLAFKVLQLNYKAIDQVA